MSRTLALAAGLATLISHEGAAQAAKAVGSSLPDTARLAREVPELLRVSGVPGLSIAVVHGGRVVWSGGFGTVNDSARRPVDTATVFEAASLSKPVFTYLVLRLADRGELDLDRPLFELLEYPRLAHDPRYRKITARIVLSHATGLPNWGGDTLHLRFDPGTDYGYSGEGFVFLQKALERATGLPLDALAEREVFRPLGMTRSSYVWQERFAGNAAWATDWLWRVAPLNRYADGNAAASLVTTAGDYARFVAAVLTGSGLSAGMWKTFLAPGRETDPGIHIALGIRVEDGAAGRRFFHSGSNGRRFTCYMEGDPGTGVGMVFFTSTYGGTRLVRALASRVFGDAHPPRHWDWYDRYDDPRLLAIRSVQRAAVERGPGPARERLRTVQAAPATRLSFDDVLELGAFLSGRGLDSLALEVLRAAVGARRPPRPGTSLSAAPWSPPGTSRGRSPRTAELRRWTPAPPRPTGTCAGPRSGRRPARGGWPSPTAFWRAMRGAIASAPSPCVTAGCTMEAVRTPSHPWCRWVPTCSSSREIPRFACDSWEAECGPRRSWWRSTGTGA